MSKATKAVTFSTIRRTQYPELSYQRQGDGWRFIDNSTGNVVGPYYPTVATIVADLERYAAVFGCK